MSLPLHAEFSDAEEETGPRRVHGELASETGSAYAAEVTSLRQRISELERQLAERLPHASQEIESTGDSAPPTQPAADSTDGTDLSGECVSQNSLTDAHAATMGQHEFDDAAGDFATLYDAESGPETWTDPDASFEERMAARAFFDGERDESARRWLLDD